MLIWVADARQTVQVMVLKMQKRALSNGGVESRQPDTAFVSADKLGRELLGLEMVAVRDGANRFGERC